MLNNAILFTAFLVEEEGYDSLVGIFPASHAFYTLEEFAKAMLSSTIK
jgi:mannose-1-phosphate guanylyltransferase